MGPLKSNCSRQFNSSRPEAEIGYRRHVSRNARGCGKEQPLPPCAKWCRLGNSFRLEVEVGFCRQKIPQSERVWHRAAAPPCAKWCRVGSGCTALLPCDASGRTGICSEYRTLTSPGICHASLILEVCIVHRTGGS